MTDTACRSKLPWTSLLPSLLPSLQQSWQDVVAEPCAGAQTDDSSRHALFGAFSSAMYRGHPAGSSFKIPSWLLVGLQDPHNLLVIPR